MFSKLPPKAARSTSQSDALRGLCFGDEVFRQRYQGWAVLGRGSYATVVKTHSRDAGRDFALKIFVSLEPQLVDRVRQEVRAAQALATPYVVRTYSLFDRGPITWFEMELVEGLNLQQRLDRWATEGDEIPLAQAYEIALGISRCLWHAHRHGVVHRDIKPSNILLPRAGVPAAKVTDFGIARPAAVLGFTPSGAITGTPRFASPEALAGRPVGRAHDVYSLCATLYALFSRGGSPYETSRTSIASLRKAQIEYQPTPLTTTVLDPDVSRSLLQGLSPDPRRRPAMRKIVIVLERAQALAKRHNRSRRGSK